MPFKINLGTKDGKTFKLEADAPALVGKKLNDKVKGEEVHADLAGYEFELTGASDKSGFTAMKGVEGIGLKKELLTYGKAMHKRVRKEGKFKISTPTPKGLRLRKSVRGETISPAISQINLKVLTDGAKKLDEIYADQNAAPVVEGAESKEAPPGGVPPSADEGKAPKEEAPNEEAKPEEKKEEPKAEEKKE
jgi:small subunit ribosomal protein S6e